MTDERLRALERRWKETGALNDQAAFETELYRAGLPFTEALLRTRGGVIASVNTPDCAFSKYVSEKNRLVNRFMWLAEETRAGDGQTHSVETTYARLGRLDDVVRTLMGASHDEDTVIYRGRAAILEFARNYDFKNITDMLAVAATPLEFYQEAICEYLALGREKEAFALQGSTLEPDEYVQVDGGDINHALARYHAAQGRYDTAASLLAQDEFPTPLRAEFVTRAAAKRKDYESARRLAEGCPETLEIIARLAARNRDYDVALEIAPTAKHRSAAAYLAILEEAAMKKDYAVAQQAMRGAFVLSGQANSLFWKTAVRNGDFEIAAPYVPRKKNALDKLDLAIGNLRVGDLKEAQKFARTSPQPSQAYCNLALALSAKELIGVRDE